MKSCNKCKTTKPLSSYYADSRNKDGRKGVCKECNNSTKRLRRSDPSVREAENLKRSKSRNSRKENLKYRYNLTIEDYDNMVTQQNGLCLICEKSLPEYPHIDHCHKTDVVRGILCPNCNTSLGKFNDDPKLLRRAADYLESRGHR
jgi:hypothetical protein